MRKIKLSRAGGLLAAVSFLVILFQFTPVKALTQLGAIPNLNEMCDTFGSVSYNGSTGVLLKKECLAINIKHRGELSLGLRWADGKYLEEDGSGDVRVTTFAGKFTRDADNFTGDSHRSDYSESQTGSYIDFDEGYKPNRNEDIYSGSRADRWDVLSGDQIIETFKRAKLYFISVNDNDTLGKSFCSEDYRDDYPYSPRFFFGLKRDRSATGWGCYNANQTQQKIPSESPTFAYGLNGNLEGDLEKFNVTHAFTAGVLAPLMKEDEGEDNTFIPCREGKVFSLGDCDNPVDGYTIDATAATFDTDQTVLIEVKSDSKPDIRIRVAGAKSDTATESGGELTGSLGGRDENITCEKNWNNPLSWFLCPVFNGVADLSDWLFSQFISPFLQSPSVSTDSSDGVFKIWSNFRIYGNILLVIAMLVIVFGQTIGGGIIDAYTAKKVMPRILAAAILINLSIYIVALMVDITNIIGKGIGDLMLAPIRNSDALQGLQLSFSQSFGALGLGALGAIVGAAGIAGVLGAILFGGGAAITAGLYVGLLTLLPVILSIIGVFVTLILRRGLIIFLIIISPIAFALYCLPNTEQYFRKWWELLFKTLMAYPIIVAIFAIADIMSVTLLEANDIAGVNGQINNVLAAIVVFVLQFLPLLLIPFAFKFAGGAIASIHAAITGGAGKLSGMFEKRKEYAQKDWRAKTLAARDRQYRQLGKVQNDRTNSAFKRGAASFLRDRIGGYNLEEALAAQREAEFKLQDLQNNNGDDTEQRALTVNKAWALAEARGEMVKKYDKDGKLYQTNGHVRQYLDDAGNVTKQEFRTLGGAWVDEASVDKAQQRWGGNQMALQWSLGHEMDKAASQEEQDYLKQNFGRLVGADGGFAMDDTQAQGVWKGAGFQKQNVNRQWKHYGWKDSERGLQLDGQALMKEIDEKQGNYQMLMQNADTWTTMAQTMEQARDVLATPDAGDEAHDEARDILERGARIAWATKASSYADVRPDDSAAAGTAPVALPPEVALRGGGGGRPVGAGAPGRVMQEAGAFVNIAESIAGPYTPQAGLDPTTARPAGSVNDSLNERRGRGRRG